MIDPLTVSGAWSATKEIFNISKRIFDLKVSDEVKKEVQSMIDKSSELYDRIVALEDERQSNRELISQLQEKIKQSKNFNREFKKYKPYQFPSGALVYVYDDSIYKDKPVHYVCTKCVNKSEISILQPKDRTLTVYICHSCSSEYIIKAASTAVAFTKHSSRALYP